MNMSTSPSPAMSRLEWLLGMLLAGLVAIVGIASFAWWQGRDVAQSTPPAQPAARGSYLKAEPVARRWAIDANLLYAQATWPAGTTFPVGAAQWTYIFYSPSQAATALVAVAGGQATLTSIGTATDAIRPADVAIWTVDSTQFVEYLMANGGQDFIAARGPAVLTVRLDGSGPLVWQGLLINAQTRQTFQLDLAAGAAWEAGPAR